MTVVTSDSTLFGFGLAALTSAAVFLAMTVLPDVPPLLYRICKKQIRKCNPTKLALLNFGVVISIAGLILRRMFNEQRGDIELVSLPVMILSALFLVGVFVQALWLSCKNAGFLEPLSEDDNELGEVRLYEKAGQRAYLAQVAAMEGGRSPVSTRGPATAWSSPGSKKSSDTNTTTSTRASIPF
jgi:hypothetical protein